MFPVKQQKRNKKPQPIYISVSRHAEFCLTSCEHGRLPSPVLQRAGVAGIVKKANYSITERKHFSARGVQAYNHHMERESSKGSASIQPSYRRVIDSNCEWKNP